MTKCWTKVKSDDVTNSKQLGLVILPPAVRTLVMTIVRNEVEESGD